jgi:hypothetical protein
MTAGLNVGFKPANLGEEIPPKQADFNGLTVKAWQQLVLQKCPTKEAFDAMVKKRCEKDAGK